MRKRMVVAVLAALILLALLLTASSVVAGPPWPGSELPDIQGEVIMAAMVGEKINYQGRLTDSGGSPLDGTYDFGFHFYDAESGGTDLGHSDVLGVTVSDGLFNVKIPVTQSWFNGQALWLGVYVRSSGGSWESLAPRQEIVPVPYALSLRPGAKIYGTVNSAPALSIVNDGSGTATGLVAQGTTTGVAGVSTTGHGVWGIAGGSGAGVLGWNSSSGPGVVGYSASGAAIQANGKITSSADSYIWIAANSYAEYNDGDFTHSTQSTGYLLLTATGAGGASIELPADIPLVLYGQPVRVEEIELCYYTSNSASYIDRFAVYKTSNTGTTITMVDNSTNYGDTTYTCCAYTPDAGTQLMAADQGGLSTVIWVHGAAAGHQIRIYGLRIRLGHTG